MIILCTVFALAAFRLWKKAGGENPRLLSPSNARWRRNRITSLATPVHFQGRAGGVSLSSNKCAGKETNSTPTLLASRVEYRVCKTTCVHFTRRVAGYLLVRQKTRQLSAPAPPSLSPLCPVSRYLTFKLPAFSYRRASRDYSFSS